jgi:hypothetical protein
VGLHARANTTSAAGIMASAPAHIEDEEHLEAAEVGEGLERFDVDVPGLELGRGQARRSPIHSP